MKILKAAALSLIIISLFSSCTLQKERTIENELQKFLTSEQIVNNLSKDTGLKKNDIQQKYLWVEYLNMDEDPQLELLVSYRDQIHRGFYLVYDYKNNNYSKIFMQPWAVEKMDGHETVVAAGNDKVHQLTAYIAHLEKGKVYLLWDGIIDKYDYTNLSNSSEIHGSYYVDTNGILHYFYKIDKTDANGKVMQSKFNEELFMWVKASNRYVRIQ